MASIMKRYFCPPSRACFYWRAWRWPQMAKSRRPRRARFPPKRACCRAWPPGSWSCLLPVSLTATLFPHFFVAKYLMLALFGVLIAVPIGLSAASGRNLVAGLALFVAFAGHVSFIFARGTSGYFRGNEFTTLTQLERALPDLHKDIVIASPFFFLPLYESGGAGRSREVYLYDTDKSVEYSGTDSVERVYRALVQRSCGHIEAYDRYAAVHQSFYVASAGPVVGVNEWLMTHLAHISARRQYVATVGGLDIFDVTLPAAVRHGSATLSELTQASRGRPIFNEPK